MTSHTERATGVTEDILDVIGDTPLYELSGLDTDATIYTKLEFVNPSGSIKDRIYREMITSAEDRGDLEPGMEILECSTGNAGIACTFVGSQRGYDVTIVMPEGMSEERKKLIRGFGGELVETPGGESDVDLALDRVDEMLEEQPDQYWFPNQFSNPDNPLAHEKTTGEEVLTQLGEAPDAFVAGQGTGGTLTGTGRRLREVDESTLLYAVEPSEAPLLTEAKWGSHGIEGIGDGFVPENLDVSMLDGVAAVDTEDAITRARQLASEEGLFCGISSGANVEAAVRIGNETDAESVVTIICDTGQRYFSTDLFADGQEVEIPEREHPIDERSQELLETYQGDWHILK